MRLRVCLVVVSLWLSSAIHGVTRAASPQATAAAPSAVPAQPAALLKQYGVTCHNERLKTGGLTLDSIDLTNTSQPVLTKDLPATVEELQENVGLSLATRSCCTAPCDSSPTPIGGGGWKPEVSYARAQSTYFSASRLAGGRLEMRTDVAADSSLAFRQP